MNDTSINFTGWLLFIGSAIGYIVSSLRSGDIPALIGSILFLLACLVFLIPFARRRLRTLRRYSAYSQDDPANMQNDGP